MTILNALSGVATVFLMGLLGFILARTGLVGPEVRAAIPRFVTAIALPPYLIRTATTTMDKEKLLSLISGAGIPFASIFLAFGLALTLALVLKIERARKGPFCVGFATSNAMNIGLPINITLFGEAALPYALLYFFANVTTFWTVGCYSIVQSGSSGADARLFSFQTVKRICSPPLVGFVCGLLLVYFEIQLPVFIDKTLKYVGDMTIALGTMFVGVMVSSINRSDLHLDRDIAVVFIGRFCISPLIIICLTWLFPVPPLMRSVFIIQSSLPVMINAAVLAAHYKADVRYATILTGFSTLLSIVTIPLYMTFITLYIN